MTTVLADSNRVDGGIAERISAPNLAGEAR